ncbi:MAG: hypothetical protein ABI988_17205, partial [Nitrospirota bacterium]
IGRAQAVAQIGLLRLSGLSAWLLWCAVHIFLLIEFRSRVRVMSEWIWYYLTFKPGARIIYMKTRQAIAEAERRHLAPRGLTRRNDSVPKIEKQALPPTSRDEEKRPASVRTTPSLTKSG